ncbi:MAG: Gfo/Idh/MocA family oxidoreductase [Cyclobacteriaceae bacterium]
MNNSKKPSHSRRKFISDSTRAAAGIGLSGMMSAPLISTARNRIIGANEMIRVGLIGARGMGFGDLSNAMKQPDAECIALCDIDDEILARRTADVIDQQGNARRPANYKDYRKMLEDKDLDAVIIGTPDHWHCLPFIEACEAGKDVYVEKPLANSIGECDLMIRTARKYNRVAQVGQQQRSGPHWQEAMEIMRMGGIGKLRKVLVWANFAYGVGAPIVPDSEVPQGVDYEQWLGPAPYRPFNKSRFHGNWRHCWDYGGGLMTDWGVHLLDMALWVKDIKEPPVSVTASGGNFSHPDNFHETFDTMSVVYQMKDYTITWEHTAGIQQGPYDRLYGLAYIGNDATLVIDRQGYEVLPEYGSDGRPKIQPIPRVEGRRNHHAEHMRNFLDCMKTRKDPNCTVENGKLVAMYAHMANISLRTQSTLTWDETKRNFGKNKMANKLITPDYRAPWELPKI